MFGSKARKIMELEARLTEVEHSLCPDDAHDYYYTGRQIVLDGLCHGPYGCESLEHEESFYKCRKCKKTIMKLRQIR